MPFPSKTDAGVILAAALEQIEAGGSESLTMRGLAQDLGLTANALYRYFAGREVLLGAAADRATEALLSDLTAATDKKRDIAALRALAKSYLAFARSRPHWYALMMSGQPDTATDGPLAHDQLWRFVLGLWAPVVGPSQAPRAAVAMWGYLHGIADLQRMDAFSAIKPDAGLWGFDVFLRGLTQA